jgi:hypothetical protein
MAGRGRGRSAASVEVTGDSRYGCGSSLRIRTGPAPSTPRSSAGPLPDGPWHGWLITPRDDPRFGIDGPHPTGVEPAGEAFIPTILVADTTAAALAAGGEVLVARIPLPWVGWLVYLADTEGNLIGIRQDDPDAVWPTPAAAGGRRQVRRRRRSGPDVT